MLLVERHIGFLGAFKVAFQIEIISFVERVQHQLVAVAFALRFRYHADDCQIKVWSVGKLESIAL
jgi:hypothetical protein